MVVCAYLHGGGGDAGEAAQRRAGAGGLGQLRTPCRLLQASGGPQESD